MGVGRKGKEGKRKEDDLVEVDLVLVFLHSLDQVPT